MAQTTSLVFNGGAVPSPAPTPSGSGKAKLLKTAEITITEQGIQVTKKVICDPDSVTSVAPFMEVLTSAKLAELVNANSVLVLADGDMQYLMANASVTVEDNTPVCTAVNFLGLSKENRAKVAYDCTRITDELTLQQVIEVGEPVETDFNLVIADPEDTEQKSLIEKLEIVDNVRDPDDPDDDPLLRLETVVDAQGKRKVGINEDNLRSSIDDAWDEIEFIGDELQELPSDEHGYFNSSLYTTPGDGTTTNLVMGEFRISNGRDVHGESIEFVPTRQEGGIDYGEVWLEPGTYILATQFTLQWVGKPRGTFLPLVANVADQPFDFSYEHEDVVCTTRIITKTTRSKLVLNIAIDADTPAMGVWVKSLEVAQIASYNHPAVAHDTTLTGTGKLDSPLGVTPAAFGKVKDIPTSVSQFRTGDVIPVDGPNGPAKMPTSDLQDAILGGPIDEAVQAWLDEHPEATTTVENDSITDAKLHPSIKFNRTTDYSKYAYRLLSRDVSFSSQVTQTDTIYEIRWTFDLGGSTISLPNNCILKFNGGKLTNGILNGSDTRIEYDTTIFGNDIDFTGTWIVPDVHSFIIEAVTSSNTLKKVFKLCNPYVENNVYLDYGVYVFTPSTNCESFVAPCSNTHIHNAGTLQITPNGFNNYQLLDFKGTDFVTFEGGSIVGDVDDHDYSSGGSHEWGRCIFIRYSSHIRILNVILKDAAGDGIEIADNNSFIEVAFISIKHCGRQGISIEASEKVYVHNFAIDDIFRTLPMHAIDIEPNTGAQSAKDIVIKDGKVSNANFAFSATQCSNLLVSNIDVDSTKGIMGGGQRYGRQSNYAIRNIRVTNLKYLQHARPIQLVNVTDSIVDNVVVDGGIWDYLMDVRNTSIDDNLVLSRIVVKNATASGGFFRNVTFKDCIFNMPMLGGRFGDPYKQTDTTVFINCKFWRPGFVYGGRLSFENCVFEDPNDPTGYSEYLTCQGRTFNGISFYNCLFRFRGAVTRLVGSVSTDISFNNCTIEGNGTQLVSVVSDVSVTLSVDNCSVDFSKLSEYVGKPTSNYKIYINNTDIADQITHTSETCSASNAAKVLGTANVNTIIGKLDLGQQTVTVKQGSTLAVFGSITNGTLNINGAKIVPSYDVLESSGVTITGSPAIGTTRFNGSKYVFWNGSAWVNMDGTPLT